MHTYAELDALLHHKRTGRVMDSRRISKNLTLVRGWKRDLPEINVHLYQTDILTFYPNETLALNSHGWETYITSRWVNTYSSLHLRKDYGRYVATVGVPFMGKLLPVVLEFPRGFGRFLVTTETHEVVVGDRNWGMQIHSLVEYGKTADYAPRPNKHISAGARDMAERLRSMNQHAKVTKELKEIVTRDAFDLLHRMHDLHDRQRQAFETTLSLNEIGLAELEGAILLHGHPSLEDPFDTGGTMVAEP